MAYDDQPVAWRLRHLAGMSGEEAPLLVEAAQHIDALEAAVKMIRTHYEFAKNPYNHKQGYEDGPIKDAVVSALSLLLVNVENILNTNRK